MGYIDSQGRDEIVVTDPGFKISAVPVQVIAAAEDAPAGGADLPEAPSGADRPAAAFAGAAQP